jgi:hypothetical protein
MTQPETLTIINQDLDGCAAPITEYKYRTAKRILTKRLLAQLNQAIYPFSKISWLDGYQDFHLRRNLQHQSASQKLRPNASKSGIACPLICTRMRQPVQSSHSIMHSLDIDKAADGNSTKDRFGPGDACIRFFSE